MKLAHLNRKMVVDWPENRVPVLALEAPQQFRQALAALIQQAAGGRGPFVLSRQDQPVELAKACEVICNPLLMELNDRAAHAALGKWFKTTAASERYYVPTQEICRQTLAWISEIALECEETLTFSQELDWAQIVKVCDLRFDGEEGELPEKLLRRMRISQSFLHKECFILVHLKQYLSQSELNMLYQEAFYRKMRLLLLENICPALDPTYETAWIVDRDGCEIYPDAVY